MLEKLQYWLFNRGANKKHFLYERLGNLVQDIRTKIGKQLTK
jgi:hypothetical protein